MASEYTVLYRLLNKPTAYSETRVRGNRMLLFRVGKKNPITMEQMQDPISNTRSNAPQRGLRRLDLALAVIMMVPLGASAQNVVSTSGGSGTNTEGTVSWTIGQPVIRTVSGGGNTLTQGFQQPWADISTVVGENAGSSSNIRVYPNPTRHLLNVEIPGATGMDQMELLDAAGRIILQTNTTGDHTEIDLSAYGTGNYFLRVLNAENTVARTFKINVTR